MNKDAEEWLVFGGIGFVTLFTVAFVVFKDCGVIAWSWWWVLSPLWITAGASAGVLLLALFCSKSK